MITKEVRVALKTLQQRGVIIYPTDTIWGIGCDATNEKAINKIFSIKKRNDNKSMIILVDSLDMLRDYVEMIPEKVVEILNTSKKPTTVIYNNPKGLAKNVIAKDNTIAIRIVEDTFCKKLIRKLEKPIVSTSANISGEPTPKSFQEISASILDAVDYVVNLQHEKITTESSKIIKILDNGEVKVIRE